MITASGDLFEIHDCVRSLLSQTFDITRLVDGPPPVNLTAVAAVAVGAIVAARVFHSRLPRGAAEGLFAAALIGTACLTVVARACDAEAARTSLVHALALLSVVWLLAAGVSAGANAQRRQTRRSVFTHAALLCGAIVAVDALIASTTPETTGSTARVVDLAAVLAATIIVACLTRKPWLAYVIAALAVLIPASTGIAQRLHVNLPGAMIWAFVAAVGALAAMICHGLAHWRFRLSVWHSDPARLAEPIGRPTALFACVVAAAVAGGLIAILEPGSRLAAPTLAFAALACFNVFHRVGGGPAGDVGMILLCGGVVTLATGWLPASKGLIWSYALIGVATAGLYANWLGNFWQQQLLDGRPWTSTGRLIPAAKRCALAAAIGSAVIAMCIFQLQLADAGTFAAASGALLTLLLSLRLLRDPDAGEGAVGKFCGWPALAACTVLIGDVIDGDTDSARLWMPLIALAGLSAAIHRGRSRRADDGSTTADNCWINGFLPVMILLCGAALGGGAVQSWEWPTAVALLAAAIVLARPLAGLTSGRRR